MMRYNSLRSVINLDTLITKIRGTPISYDQGLDRLISRKRLLNVLLIKKLYTISTKIPNSEKEGRSFIYYMEILKPTKLFLEKLYKKKDVLNG